MKQVHSNIKRGNECKAILSGGLRPFYFFLFSLSLCVKKQSWIFSIASASFWWIIISRTIMTPRLKGLKNVIIVAWQQETLFHPKVSFNMIPSFIYILTWMNPTEKNRGNFGKKISNDKVEDLYYGKLLYSFWQLLIYKKKDEWMTL